jgi:hypothetical protein
MPSAAAARMSGKKKKKKGRVKTLFIYPPFPMARLLSTLFLHFASFNFLLVHQGHVLLFHPNHRRSNRKSQVYIYSYISYIYRNIILFIASVYCRPLLHNIPRGCRMRRNKFQSMTMWKMRNILDEHWDTPDKYNHLSILWYNFTNSYAWFIWLYQ